MRPVLVAMKLRGLSVYDRPTLDGHAMPTRVEQVGARHRGGGGNLRAAGFGVNDGLVSNASLIMVVAGAGVESGFATDMDAPELADQVVSRVRGINFGAKEGVRAMTIVYPIDFLPAA